MNNEFILFNIPVSRTSCLTYANRKQGLEIWAIRIRDNGQGRLPGT